MKLCNGNTWTNTLNSFLHRECCNVVLFIFYCDRQNFNLTGGFFILQFIVTGWGIIFICSDIMACNSRGWNNFFFFLSWKFVSWSIINFPNFKLWPVILWQKNWKLFSSLLGFKIIYQQSRNNEPKRCLFNHVIYQITTCDENETINSRITPLYSTGTLKHLMHMASPCRVLAS